MRRLVGLSTLLLASCCFQGTAEGDGGGAPCTRDVECGAGEYCEAQFTACPVDLPACSSPGPRSYPGSVLAGGSCHRDCSNGACVCTSDADCPTSSCSAGKCLPVYYDPGPSYYQCPADCPATPFTDRLGTLCLCTSCPGGSSSSGTSGGVACTADSQCGSGSYCDVPLTSCTGYHDYAVEQGSGICHRDCLGGACSCESDADCPGGWCAMLALPDGGLKSSGICALPGGGDCAFQGCDADCPQTAFKEEDCPVCLCSACPGLDAG